MRKLSHQEIVDRQKKLSVARRIRLTVVLNDIRSLHNVGAIFRTADGAGVEKIWLCGITGAPPQSQIHQTALGAEERIPWEYNRDAVSVVKQLAAQGYQVVLLEQTDESEDCARFVPSGPVCLVIGNEITGIDDRLVSLAHAAIEIPMAGIKNSLNVSVAFGIAVYHIREKLADHALFFK